MVNEFWANRQVDEISKLAASERTKCLIIIALILYKDRAEQAGVVKLASRGGSCYGPGLPLSLWLGGVVGQAVVPGAGHIDCQSVLAFLYEVLDIQ